MKRKVLIAGAGQLGSRYLQGLSKCAESMDIYVFDPSLESLVRARARWDEMQSDVAHEVQYLHSLTALPHSIDLAIVATTADVRAAVVTEIVSYTDVTYWLLEKVLAQNVDQIGILQKILHGKSVWVNTPMYLWSLYRELRKNYPTDTTIGAVFTGFRGLACNAIHYIDFVSRWSGESVVQIDVLGLKSEWYRGKRLGFYEVDGEISIVFNGGSKLKLISESDNLKYKAYLEIEKDKWEIFESEGVARSANGRIVRGNVEFQSQLTAPLVNEIFKTASCGLPTLAESAHQHNPFLSALLEHWNQNMPNSVNKLPIT